MRHDLNLPTGTDERVRQNLESLENAEITTVDKVSDKELFVAFEMFGVKQSSFQVKNQRQDLKAINASIAVPVEDQTEEDIRNLLPVIPDRCNIQSRLEEDGQMCMVQYNNRDYNDFMNVVKKIDKEYTPE